MAAEYLDLAYIVAKSVQESAGAGWGLVVANSSPPPSGYIPASYTQRGQSLAALLQQLGSDGRANGATVAYAGGVATVTVGLPAWGECGCVLVSPLNCREEGNIAGARSLSSVKVEAGGDQATAYNAGARFPGRELVTGGDGSAGYLAEARLNSSSRVRGGVQLRVSMDRSDLRVGDVVLYVAGRTGAGQYIRVTSIVVDEASTTEFRVTGQIVEPDALTPRALVKGAFQPGQRGSGASGIMRRVRRLESTV